MSVYRMVEAKMCNTCGSLAEDGCSSITETKCNNCGMEVTA